MLDLERAHQRGDAAGGRHVHVLHQAEDQAGAGQTNAPGKRPFVSHYKIGPEPAGATLTAFLPGQPPTPFVLLPGKDGEAVFENKAHDFPQRIEYRREGEDLYAEIGGPGEGDKEAVIPYRYRRCPQPG